MLRSNLHSAPVPHQASTGCLEFAEQSRCKPAVASVRQQFINNEQEAVPLMYLPLRNALPIAGKSKRKQPPRRGRSRRGTRQGSRGKKRGSRRKRKGAGRRLRKK